MVSHPSSALAPDTNREFTDSWSVCRVRCRRHGAAIDEAAV